jgi:hypothetical protein
MFKFFTFFFPAKNRKTKQYFSLFIGESTLQDVCALFNHIPHKKIIVNKRIQFQKLAFGISPFKTRLKLGLPACRHKFEYDNLQHKIYTYKNIGKLRDLIVNCHFFNNKLHYIQTCMRHPDQESILKLSEIIEKRYACELRDINSEFALTNEQGEVLYYIFNLDINVYHFSGNHQITESICKEILNQKSKLLAARQKEVNILEEII